MPLRYKQAQHLEHEHKATVTALTFSPKGSFLAIASLDGTLSIWSTTSWKVMYVVAAGGVACLSILWTSNTEDRLLCGLANGVVVSMQITHQVNTALYLSRILSNWIPGCHGNQFPGSSKPPGGMHFHKRCHCSNWGTL